MLYSSPVPLLMYTKRRHAAEFSTCCTNIRSEGLILKSFQPHKLDIATASRSFTEGIGIFKACPAKPLRFTELTISILYTRMSSIATSRNRAEHVNVEHTLANTMSQSASGLRRHAFVSVAVAITPSPVSRNMR
uniref:AlNc14C191G8446 protein n=1 Tax=Albugo laibachii Nc14 TaxID=890382 RepID=F0WPV5_9STRA|nr:AlNc14C191G8446 [Albugo laibachii Nc14]|eukprot:CCA23356.1 AlNc14C191G8446 [Albugo laibachii Nc14]